MADINNTNNNNSEDKQNPNLSADLLDDFSAIEETLSNNNETESVNQESTETQTAQTSSVSNLEPDNFPSEDFGEFNQNDQSSSNFDDFSNNLNESIEESESISADENQPNGDSKNSASNELESSETIENIDKQESNSKVQKISLDEIKAAKGEIPNDQTEENNDGKAQKISLDEINRAKLEIINDKKKAEEKANKDKERADLNLPPVTSLPDDMTDEELEKYILEEQKAQEQALLEAERKLYEGMTEEEILEAKARKKKLLSLQKRFNSRDNSKASDLGEYQKGLDFTLNKDLKKFKVKPPKSLYKVLAIIICAVIIVSSVVAYLILNKPPEPVLLTSIKLSQTKTYQVVGEELDFRGLYLDLAYSDGTTKTVKASKNLVTRTSSNVNSNFKITEYLNSESIAYVYFGMDGIEVKLDITLSRYFVNSITCFIYVENITGGDKILFSDVLAIAKTNDNRELRLNPKDLTFVCNGNELVKDDKGFFIPDDTFGPSFITAKYVVSSNQTLTSEMSVYVQQKPVEPEEPTEPEEPGEGNEPVEPENPNTTPEPSETPENNSGDVV